MRFILIFFIVILISWKPENASVTFEARFKTIHKKVVDTTDFLNHNTGQALWHLTIVDSITNKSIDHATVSINNTKYFSTDVDGKINIETSQIKLKDIFYFSSVGYKTLIIIAGSHYRFPDSIKLSPATINLGEVKVNANDVLKRITLGNIKKSYNTHRYPNPDEEFAQFIPNEKQTKGIITSVEYVLNDDLYAIEMPFKVGIYSKSKDSIFPDEELIKDSLIVYNPEKKRQVSVDVSKYNIEFPEEGIFIVFQSLLPSYYGNKWIWHDGYNRLKCPGIDIDLTSSYNYTLDHDLLPRKGPYCMVRQSGDKFHSLDPKKDQWMVYTEGISFAIGVTITPY